LRWRRKRREGHRHHRVFFFVLARDHAADAADLAMDHAHRPVLGVMHDVMRALGRLRVFRGALPLGDMHRAAAEDRGSGRCRGDFC